MTLGEFESVLDREPDFIPRFILPDGWDLPDDYELTSVSHSVRRSIDRSAVLRVSETCILHLSRDLSDGDSVGAAKRFWEILRLGRRVLPEHDLEVHVECEWRAMTELRIASFENAGRYIYFVLEQARSDANLAPVGEICC